MTQIKRILCPVDFSDASTHALQQAVAVGGRYGARITALHVFNPIFAPAKDPTAPLGVISEAEVLAAEAQATVFVRDVTGGSTDIFMDVGRPAPCILDCATRIAADSHRPALIPFVIRNFVPAD